MTFLPSFRFPFRTAAFGTAAALALAGGVAQAETPDTPVQNAERVSHAIPAIMAESGRWANYATFRVLMEEESDINRVKGGVLHVHYRIDCERGDDTLALMLGGKPCPAAPIRRYTTVSCHGTEGGVIVVNLGQAPYSSVRKPYTLTLTIEKVEFIDWHGRYRLPSYCEDGVYDPAMVMTGDKWTTDPVTVN